VIAMMAMSALRGSGEAGADGGGGAGWAAVLLSLSWRLAAAAVAMFVLMRWVLPAVVAAMAHSQELLLVFAIAWGVALAALGEWAGFSKEAGAFLAGFSLASTPYREAMNARLTGIRDFLLLFFFIDLGAKLDFSTLGAEEKDCDLVVLGKHGQSATEDLLLGSVSKHVLAEGSTDVLVSTAREA